MGRGWARGKELGWARPAPAPCPPIVILTRGATRWVSVGVVGSSARPRGRLLEDPPARTECPGALAEI